MGEDFLKTPISYYGGKLNMVDIILPMIDYSKKQFVSLFTGGGAVEIAKKKHEVEVWNDLDRSVITFWEVLQEDFYGLQKMIQETLHAEHYHIKAKKILEYPRNYTKLERAWAFWVQTNMSFSNRVFGGFAFANDNSRNGMVMNKREAFKEYYYERVKNIQIFCRDALDLIDLKDTEDTFFFADPPYISSEQGYQIEYTEGQFLNLIDRLSKIKGTFLLTSYEEDILKFYRDKFGWHTKDTQFVLAVDGKREEKKHKKECITCNYKAQLSLFD